MLCITTVVYQHGECLDDSLRKQSKHHGNETLTNKNIQALAKNHIGLFIKKDCISANEIYAVLTNPQKPSTQ